MADDKTLPQDDQAELDAATRAAVPGSDSTQGSAGAIPDETMTAADLLETDAIRAKRRAAGNAVDNNAASHQGGIGAQGGQTDFGAAGNLSGYDKTNF